jgi:ribosomal protein S18 acetylase RimI-like enzyme
MQMKIRKGRLKNTKELLILLNGTPELQGVGEKDSYSSEFVRGTIKSKSRNLVLIAEDKGEIVGLLMAELWKNKKFSFLLDIFVKEEYRNKGTASMLEEEYERICKKLKINEIDSLVLLDNQKMQKWCSKNDYKQGNKFFYYSKELK